MKKKRLLVLGGTALLLTGCGIFPKEEELQRTPIIQAYQQEEFRMAKVKRGDLKLYEKLDAVCMGLNETSYSFAVNDLPFEGIYVKEGDMVAQGTLLARLTETVDNKEVANRSQLSLVAEQSGKVTYALQPDAGGKSISGQLVVIVNGSDGYYLNAYTKYWDKFTPGMQVVMRIQGADYTATVIKAEDIGLETLAANPGESAQVYFHVKADGLYLHSTEAGTVTILIDERKDVLNIPKSAITKINDKEIVYIENEDGIRSVKEVQIGLVADDKVEILNGLTEGDSVILD